jgi:hypothetical protein
VKGAPKPAAKTPFRMKWYRGCTISSGVVSRNQIFLMEKIVMDDRMIDRARQVRTLPLRQFRKLAVTLFFLKQTTSSSHESIETGFL